MSLQKHPIAHFTHLLQRHRAFRLQNLSRITAYYLGIIAREPFRIYEKLKFNDEAIDSVKIEKDPLFVLGHWRSGTSYLQYLLAKDPQFGYLSRFQSIFPDMFLGSESFMKPFIQSIFDNRAIINAIDSISINVDWDAPAEVDIALTALFSSVTPHWGHIFPKNGQPYFDKYLFFEEASPAELAQWQKVHKHLLKKLTLKNQGKQLVIKSPGNTARVNRLLELYPNAKFIYIHRNPYDVFYSNRKLWNLIISKLALQEYSQQEIDEKIIEIYKRVIRRYRDERANIPEQNLCELQFEDFVVDPVSALRNAYQKLNIDEFENAKNHFQSFVRKTEKNSASSYQYDLEIVERIKREWQESLSEWPYPDPLETVSEKEVA